MAILSRVSWYLTAVLIGIFLTVIPGIFSGALWPSGYLLWTNVHLDLWPVSFLFIELIVFLILSCCLHVLKVNSIFKFSCKLFFSPFWGDFFPPLFSIFLAVPKDFMLMRSLLLSLIFFFSLFWELMQKELAAIYVKACSACIFLKRFRVIIPPFSSLINLEFLFLHGVWECCNFTHFSLV